MALDRVQIVTQKGNELFVSEFALILLRVNTVERLSLVKRSVHGLAYDN